MHTTHGPDWYMVWWVSLIFYTYKGKALVIAHVLFLLISKIVSLRLKNESENRIWLINFEFEFFTATQIKTATDIWSAIQLLRYEIFFVYEETYLALTSSLSVCMQLYTSNITYTAIRGECELRVVCEQNFHLINLIIKYFHRQLFREKI